MTSIFPASSGFRKPNQNSREYRKYCEELNEIYDLLTSGSIEFFTKYSLQDLCKLKLSNYHRSILHLAVWNHQLPIIDKILSEPIFSSLLNQQDINGDTPLHLAVFSRNFEGFRKLKDLGATLQIANKKGEYPLDVAINPEAWSQFFVEKRENQNNQDDPSQITKTPVVKLQEKIETVSQQTLMTTQVETQDKKTYEQTQTTNNLITNSIILETQNKRYDDATLTIMTENVITNIDQMELQNKNTNCTSTPLQVEGDKREKTPKPNNQENQLKKPELSNVKLKSGDSKESNESIFLFNQYRQKMNNKQEVKNEWESIFDLSNVDDDHNKKTLEKSIQSSQNLRPGKIIYLPSNEKEIQNHKKEHQSFWDDGFNEDVYEMSITNRGGNNRYRQGKNLDLPKDQNKERKWKNFSQNEGVVAASQGKNMKKESHNLSVPKKPALDATFLTQGSEAPLYQGDD